MLTAAQGDCAACFEYYAGLADKLDQSREQAIDVGDASFSTFTRQGPVLTAAVA